MQALTENVTQVGPKIGGYYELYNHTSRYNETPATQSELLDAIAAGIVIGIIIFVIVFGNCMVIIAVLKDRLLKQAPQNRFILSLAAADMLLGILIMPISLHLQILGYWALQKPLCDVWLATDVFLCTASTLSLVVVSVDRYWSVTNALEYPQLRTPKKVNIGIAGIWLTSALVSLPPLAGWKSSPPSEDDVDPQCNLSNELGYIIYSLTISFYIPLIIIFIAYGRIFQVARRRANQHIKLGTIQNPSCTSREKKSIPAADLSTQHSLSPSINTTDSSEHEYNNCPSDSEVPQLNNNEPIKTGDSKTDCEEEPRTRKFTLFASRFMHRPSKTNPKDAKQVEVLLKDQQQARRLRNQRGRERRATITIAVIVLAFAVCWLPFSLVYLIDRICECGVRDSKAFAAIFWLGYCNSAVNPMLYSIFNRDFRQAFVRLLCNRR